MNAISVSIKPPTIAGRLYPKYDEESKILSVESRVVRAWPFGADIDGRLVFDIDENRILANFDLHIPKSRWERNIEKNSLTINSKAGDLEFSQNALVQKSFHVPLRVKAHAETGKLWIEIGAATPNRAVALSESCIALLAGDELAGFVVDGVL